MFGERAFRRISFQLHQTLCRRLSSCRHLQTSRPADTGVGACICKPTWHRSILATCTENRLRFEETGSLPPFGPETSHAEHFCKMAGHFHTTQPAHQTLEDHVNLRHVNPAFLFTRDWEYPRLVSRGRERTPEPCINRLVSGPLVCCYCSC